MDYKVCRTCKQRKPISEFHENRAAWEGKLEKCNSCINPSKMYNRCYIAGCGNPLKSKSSSACSEHSIYACEVCGGTENLVRDHDHSCHKETIKVCCFRGFLCSRCNIGVGLFNDSPKLLREAALYLERPRRTIIRVPRSRRKKLNTL